MGRSEFINPRKSNLTISIPFSTCSERNTVLLRWQCPCKHRRRVRLFRLPAVIQRQNSATLNQRKNGRLVTHERRRHLVTWNCKFLFWVSYPRDSFPELLTLQQWTLRKRTRNQLDIMIGNREESAYQVQGLESMIGSVNSKFTIHGWHPDQVGLESETADHTPLIRFPSSKNHALLTTSPVIQILRALTATQWEKFVGRKVIRENIHRQTRNPKYLGESRAQIAYNCCGIATYTLTMAPTMA